DNIETDIFEAKSHLENQGYQGQLQRQLKSLDLIANIGCLDIFLWTKATLKLMQLYHSYHANMDEENL
ncbi:10683_t:CDS:2, partial [Paraglomus brasilianum]